MLALDRPGYGLSDPVDDVDLSARSHDLIEACGLLGVHEFAVAGTSGGGTYAPTVSALATDHVSAAITISGQARLDTPWALDGMQADLAADWAIEDVETGRREADDEVAALAAPAEQALEVWESWFHGFPDDEVAFIREARAVFVEDGHELSRQGGHGFWIDGQTRAQAWPFKPADLSMPVHLFHGTADSWNPCQALLTDLEGAPNLTTTLYHGGNHLSPLTTTERRMSILQAARSALD